MEAKPLTSPRAPDRRQPPASASVLRRALCLALGWSIVLLVHGYWADQAPGRCIRLLGAVGPLKGGKGPAVSVVRKSDAPSRGGSSHEVMKAVEEDDGIDEDAALVGESAFELLPDSGRTPLPLPASLSSRPPSPPLRLRC